jgi:hypothetical protein
MSKPANPSTSALPRGQCRSCRFWDAVRDEDGTLLGLCRHGPPAYEGWPMTGPEDWCGEYQQNGGSVTVMPS